MHRTVVKSIVLVPSHLRAGGSYVRLARSPSRPRSRPAGTYRLTVFSQRNVRLNTWCVAVGNHRGSIVMASKAELEALPVSPSDTMHARVHAWYRQRNVTVIRNSLMPDSTVSDVVGSPGCSSLPFLCRESPSQTQQLRIISSNRFVLSVAAFELLPSNWDNVLMDERFVHRQCTASKTPSGLLISILGSLVSGDEYPISQLQICSYCATAIS